MYTQGHIHISFIKAYNILNLVYTISQIQMSLRIDNVYYYCCYYYYYYHYCYYYYLAHFIHLHVIHITCMRFLYSL